MKDENQEVLTSKVCFGNRSKCVCGGKHILYSDYTDPMCGLPILDLIKKEKENVER